MCCSRATNTEVRRIGEAHGMDGLNQSPTLEMTKTMSSSSGSKKTFIYFDLLKCPCWLNRAHNTWVSLDGHTWVLLSLGCGMVSEVSPESESSGLTELSRSFSLS